MKQPVLVRFANDAHHSTIIDLDVTKLTDVMKFPKEIFGNIDGIRIAILREEYEQLIKDNGKETNEGTKEGSSIN